MQLFYRVHLHTFVVGTSENILFAVEMVGNGKIEQRAQNASKANRSQVCSLNNITGFSDTASVDRLRR